MNNIVQTKRTPVAGRRPTGGMPGELYFNFADRTIGCVDENGNPVDIATAISVSALPPASPVAGQLWYRTAVPAGLYIWFVDADSAQWVQVAGGGSGGGGGGGGASVEIGDTPPENPVEGQFWFSTVVPVGLYIWFVDADSAQWVQVGGSSAPLGGVPIGTVAFFAGPTAPPGWLTCNNQRVSSAYPELRQYLLDAGAPFGMTGEDPRVPELRGEFVRGASMGRVGGGDDGRVFGSWQADQLQRLTGAIADAQILGGAADVTTGVLRRGAATNSAIWQGATSVARNSRFSLDTAFDPTVRSGDETRPRNVALLPCIRAFDTLTVGGSANFNIATEQQAREGASIDTLMTPALVRALKEEQFLALGALPFVDSGLIPPEASDITITLNINRGTNSVVDLVAPDDAGATYNGTIISEGATYTAPAAIPTTSFLLNNDAGTGTVQGTVRMALNRETGIWWAQSELRRGANLTRTTGAFILSSGVPLSRLRVRNSVPGVSGNLSLLWRI